MTNEKLSLLLPLLIILFYSCGTEEKRYIDSSSSFQSISGSEELITEEDGGLSSSNIENQETIEIPAELEKPKEPEAVKKIKEKQKINSQFVKLTCCDEEQNRKKECCCKKVVAAYEKIFITENLAQLAKLPEDVIFNDCKQIPFWRKKIEEIENAEEEELF